MPEVAASGSTGGRRSRRGRPDPEGAGCGADVARVPTASPRWLSSCTRSIHASLELASVTAFAEVVDLGFLRGRNSGQWQAERAVALVPLLLVHKSEEARGQPF